MRKQIAILDYLFKIEGFNFGKQVFLGIIYLVISLTVTLLSKSAMGVLFPTMVLPFSYSTVYGSILIRNASYNYTLNFNIKNISLYLIITSLITFGPSIFTLSIFHSSFSANGSLKFLEGFSLIFICLLNSLTLLYISLYLQLHFKDYFMPIIGGVLYFLLVCLFSLILRLGGVSYLIYLIICLFVIAMIIKLDKEKEFSQWNIF